MRYDYGIFIQARMSSKRAPGKVTTDIYGKPMIVRQMERLKNKINDLPIVCLTSTDESDDPIEDVCNEFNFKCFRDSNDFSSYLIIFQNRLFWFN